MIVELLASPWIVRASDLTRKDGSCAAKHAEEPVEVAWDRRAPATRSSFTRDGRVYRIDAIVQIWATERSWWDPRQTGVSAILAGAGARRRLRPRLRPRRATLASHRHPGLAAVAAMSSGIRAPSRALAVQLHGRRSAARRRSSRVRPNSRCRRSRSPTTRGCREPSGSTRRAKRRASSRSSAARSWSRPPASWASEADLPPERAARAAGERGIRARVGVGLPPHAALPRLRAATATCAGCSRRRTCAGPHEPSIVTLRDLATHAEGLIALSGCRNGEAASAVLARRAGTRARGAAAARRRASRPATSTSSSCTRSPPTARGSWAGSSTLADELALPVVATNNVHYLRSEDHRLHDVLSAAGARTALPGPYDRPNAELWLKPAAEMRRLFEGLPRACDATLEIAAKCQLELPLGQFHFPAADIPRGETPYSVLAKESWRGLERRYQPMTPEAISRLQHELVAHRLDGVLGVLPRGQGDRRLRASREGIRCSGRGSAGDSHRELRARHHRRRPGRATTCSSSGSSTPSAARCPTSTWTSTRPAETRSSTSSTSGSVTSTSRWSRPSTR